jgi:SAM-dependent methyltransferase
MRKEAQAVLARYARRTRVYDPLDPAVYLSRQELERALIRWLRASNLGPTEKISLFELGCGSGGILLQLLRLGFAPDRLMGSELQIPLVTQARALLPAAIRLLPGDALDVDLADETFDVVLQSLVFSSILDDAYQEQLAAKMWSLTRPGGGVLWLDFTVNNPANPDVRGVPMRRVRELFPDGVMQQWRLHLAPPLSRAVTRIHPMFYHVFNAMPFLRTHVLCWLRKPARPDQV